MEFAERLGFEVLRWEGSAIWHNRKYMELKDSGYDFKKVSQLPVEKREKRLDALDKNGMRAVRCMANEGDPEKDLGGHLCVIVRADSECFFVDPTSFQFQREPQPPKRPGRMEVPEYIVTPMVCPESAEINFLYRYRGGAGVYLHAPVNRYREKLALTVDEQLNTGVSPRLYPDLYLAIEKGLGLESLTLNSTNNAGAV
jgi:hypothetical protein